MKKITLLTGLLIFQIVLAFILLYGGSKLNLHTGIQKLLEFDPEQINAIQITDETGQTIRLTYDNSTWFTDEKFPADSTRVDRLLNQLNELEHGLAVASLAKTAERFEVSPKQFQRHLQLFEDEQIVVDIYLGTGAGARRSHVRLANGESIFSTTIGSYDLPATLEEWQNKELLLMNADQVDSIEFDAITIRKTKSELSEDNENNEADVSIPQKEQWIAEALNKGETLKTDALKSLLRNLTNLRYTRILKGSTDKKQLQAQGGTYGADSITVLVP